MSKIQSRRTVKVSTETYDKLRAYCECNGVSMSSLVEARVLDYLDAQPAPPENLLEETPLVAALREPAATEMYRRAHEVKP